MYFPYNLPFKHSEHTVILHLAAYEDGTDRVFRKVGI